MFDKLAQQRLAEGHADREALCELQKRLSVLRGLRVANKHRKSLLKSYCLSRAIKAQKEDRLRQARDQTQFK